MALRVLVGLLAGAVASASQTEGYADENGGTTGGSGGKSVTVSTGKELHTALCTRGSKTEKIVIYVSGTITLGNTEKVSGSSCNTADDRIELKEIENVSIIGKGKAVFDQIGIHIRGSKNIILQNLHVKNVKKSNGATSNGGDAIGMEKSVSNVWVDHCTLEASGGESSGYDGLCDMKGGTKYVTVSYTIFKNSGRGGLVGSSDSDLSNGPVTYHHNYYQNLDSRVPLLRGATAHSYNNYFKKINKSAINSRVGAKIRVENNYFKDATNPLGTFYTSKTGYWHTSGNVLSDCTWSSSDSPAGPSMKSTTSMSIPYSYTSDKASCVPDVVGSTAGVYTNKEMKTSSGSCSTSSSPPSGSPSSTPTPPSSTPTPPSSPPTSSGSSVEGTFVIKVKSSDKVVDVSGKSKSNNGNIITWSSNGGANQHWKIEGVDGGYYRVLNVHSTYAMHVKDKSKSDGASVVQYKWNKYKAQQWTIEKSGNYYVFKNRNSGKVLDASGDDVVQRASNGGSGQLFSLESPSSSSGSSGSGTTPTSSSSSANCVGLWGGCLEGKCCTSGTCYGANQWYAQCRTSCSVSGWSCNKL